MATSYATRMSTTPSSFIREILHVTEDPSIISFAGGLPHPDTFPVQAIADAATHVLTTHGSEALQYRTTEGHRPLREFVAQRYRTQYGLDVEAEQIIITSGSQQAQDLVGKVFLNPGDRVLIEQPSYLGAIQAFSLFEVKFIAVPLCDDGIDIEQVAAMLDREQVKIVYTVPTFQNPSGICYSLQKRKALASLLREAGVVLIEDDPYRELRFAGEQLPPVAKFLPEQTVLVGSFSKIFSPGMRLGWLCMPKPMVRHFTVAKQATDLHTNVFCQYLLAQYLQTNDLEAHIAAIRARYKQQRDTMVSAIERYCPPQVTCTKPEGGMFLWMTLPEGVSSQELFARAIREQVAFVPGIPFFTDGSGDRYLRLNFSNADPAMIDEGMQRLGRAIKLMLEETTAGE